MTWQWVSTLACGVVSTVSRSDSWRLGDARDFVVAGQWWAVADSACVGVGASSLAPVLTGDGHVGWH